MSDFLRPDTGIPGVYLTGQDIFSPGVFPSCLGGVFTGMSVVGYPSILDLLQGRDIFKNFHFLRSREQGVKYEYKPNPLLDISFD